MKSTKQIFALVAVVMATISVKSQTWTTNGTSAICKTNGNSVRLTVKKNGTVWIGDSTGTQKTTNTLLYVDGSMKARELIINMSNWPDYVFDSCYSLMPLDQVNLFIDSAGHLPSVPSQNEIFANGLTVGQMNEIMMKKIEELQLYILQLNARIKELESKSTSR